MQKQQHWLSIGELAKRSDVSVAALRFYEGNPDDILANESAGAHFARLLVSLDEEKQRIFIEQDESTNII